MNVISLKSKTLSNDNTFSFFLKNFISLFSGNVSGQLVIILSSPLLARLYNPSAFGVLEIVLSLFSILSVTANLKFENAIVIQKNNTEADKVFALCLTVNACMFFLSLLTLWLIRSININILSGVLLNWWWAPPVLGLFSGLQQMLQMTFVREKKYNIIAYMLFLQAVGLVTFQVFYGYLTTYDSSSLIYGYIVNNSIVCIILSIFLIKNTNIFNHFQKKILFKKAVKCKNFLFYTVPTSLLGALSQRGLFLVMGGFFSDTDVGLAGLALRVMYFPITLITRSMGQLFFGIFSEKVGKDTFAHEINKILRIKMSLIVFAVPLFFNMQELFILFFGARWEMAGYYAMMISPAAFMLFLTGWLDRTHDVVSRQRKALGLELTYDFFVLTGMLFFSHHFNSPLYVVCYFGFFTSLYNVVWLVLTVKLIGISYKQSFRNLFLLFSLGAASFFTYTVLNTLLQQTVLTIFLYYVCCGLGVILARKYYFNDDSFKNE